MGLRTRFLLVICGIIIFLIVAPLVILLAQGFRYDFATGRLIKTGTLVVKTNPRNALATLNGKVIARTPFVKRFITPGDYELEITRDGYHPWKKKITILPDQVFYLPQGPERISLFSARPENTVVSTTTIDFLAQGENILILEKEGAQIPKYRFWQSNWKSGEKNFLASSTLPFTDPKILDARGNANQTEFLLADQSQIWHLNGRVIKPISPNLRSVKFSEKENHFYGINTSGQLVEVLPGVDLRVIRENITEFAVADEEIYYLTSGDKPAIWRMSASDRDDLLYDSLPPFTTSDIVVTSNREIFILLDNKLYLVGEDLKKLNESIKFARWDETGKILLYGNDNELWFFRPQNQTNELLTRTSTSLRYVAFNRETYYLFLSSAQDIKAAEFDPLGQPNIYVLTETKNPNPKFAVNQEGTALVYLDRASLNILKIR